MALSPMKQILGLGKDLKYELTQVQGNAKAAIDAIISFLNAPVSATTSVWSGYHGNGYQWQTSSTSLVDPTNNTVGTFVTRVSNNLSFSPAASNLPGISFVPTSEGQIYLIYGHAPVINGTATDGVILSLTDGITEIDQTSLSDGTGATPVGANVPISGIYVTTGTSQVTLKLKMSAITAGTAFIAPRGSTDPAISWTVARII